MGTTRNLLEQHRDYMRNLSSNKSLGYLVRMDYMLRAWTLTKMIKFSEKIENMAAKLYKREKIK